MTGQQILSFQLVAGNAIQERGEIRLQQRQISRSQALEVHGDSALSIQHGIAGGGAAVSSLNDITGLHHVG